MLHLNRRYRYEGGDYDLKRLFSFTDCTEEVEGLFDEIGRSIQEKKRVLVSSTPPQIRPGAQCIRSFPCEFLPLCCKDDPSADHGLEEVPDLSARAKIVLREKGIKEIADIPENYPLSRKQRAVRQSVVAGRGIVIGNLDKALSKIKSPVHYLGFNTDFSQLPRFIGSSPFSTIPYLFSMLIEKGGEELKHTDYLNGSLNDCQEEWKDQLLSRLDAEGSICIYETEKDCKNLLKRLEYGPPNQKCRDISSRICNLYTIIKENYYHPDFRGSFSIKSVLPVMCPTSGYEKSEFVDGVEASAKYLDALKSDDSESRRATFQQLRDYGKRNCLHVYHIHQALKSL